MAYRGTAAAGDGLLSTTFGGITPAYPFTVGGWFSLFALASSSVYECALSSSGSDFFASYTTAAGLLQIVGGTTKTACANAIVVGQWYYVVLRYISATNRRLTLWEGGVIENIQNTVSNTPTGMDDEAIGRSGGSAATPSNGLFAEFFRTNSDIQPDGGVLLTSLLMQLAYKGPWSVPSVAEKIVWYNSLRQSTIDTLGSVDDPAFALNGRMGWTTTTGRAIQQGPHPPLASDYVYLNTLKQKLTV